MQTAITYSNMARMCGASETSKRSVNTESKKTRRGRQGRRGHKEGFLFLDIRNE